MKYPVILFVFFCFLMEANAQCNGFDFLCDRSYKDVSYLTTHNAFNAGEEGFFGPNQTYGLAQQLEDGVRAMMLDVYYVNGIVTLYHAESFLGNKPLSEDLEHIKTFLDENPNEIVTLIFESYVSDSAVNNVMEQVDLVPYCYSYTAAEGWPTLQELIDLNQRLIVMSDNVDSSVAPPWYHYMWDLAVETHFSNKDTADFSCNFNRGDAANELFILNHFNTSDGGGLGDTIKTDITNASPYFFNRALECWNETGKLPNFVTVDFYERGSCTEVVNELNASNPVGLIEQMEQDATGIEFNVYPNPVDNVLHLDFKQIDSQAAQRGEFVISIYDATGRLCLQEIHTQNQTVIDLQLLEVGLFYLEVSTDSQLLHRSKIIKS